MFYWRFFVYENFKYFVRIYYVLKFEMEKRIEEFLKLVGFWERWNDFVMSYLCGMKQRFVIVKVLINDFEVFFFDEFIFGLDVQSVFFVRDFVKRFVKEEGKIVFLIIYYMVEVEEFCDRIVIIDYGRIIVFDIFEGLKKFVKDEEIVEIVVREFNLVFFEKFFWKFVVVQSIEERIVFRGSVDEEDFLKLVEWFVKNQVKVVFVERKELMFEDVFIKLIGRGLRD